LKIYNTNIVGGIVGAFNCSYNPKKSVSIQDVVAASDIEGLQGNNFAVYRYSNGELSVQNTRTVNKLKIKELEYDLFTYIPIQDGFAPVGIIEKYNPAGMIINFQKVSTNIHTIDLMDGGTFIAFAEEEPHQVLLDAKPINFDYHKKSKKILITVPLGKESRLTIIQ
jgi:raffinose synthase|tara:strand:- start:614 stop:1114 length:501 start_codon:yes stop_codon:yes gene_type:complete